MITLDQIVFQIVNYRNAAFAEFAVLEPRDAGILQSMSAIIASSNFLTENQARLLMRILRNHQEKLNTINNELADLLDYPKWSRPFRICHQTKKLSISNRNDELMLTIEVSPSSHPLETELANISKTVPIKAIISAGKVYCAELTEKNIITLVSRLKKLDFEIDEKLQNYYQIIQSWNASEVLGRFRIDTITHPNFQKQITNDLGIDTPIDQNIINDRSLRYQYFHEKNGKNPENFPKN